MMSESSRKAAHVFRRNENMAIEGGGVAWDEIDALSVERGELVADMSIDCRAGEGRSPGPHLSTAIA